MKILGLDQFQTESAYQSFDAWETVPLDRAAMLAWLGY